MSADIIGRQIAVLRKQNGMRQEDLATFVGVSVQAVSKWENGTASPDISLLAPLAHILNTTVDTMVGYSHEPFTHYEEKYKDEQYYWGITPNRLCYEIMKLMPPIKPYRVLDIGCGEGKDAVFLAKTKLFLAFFLLRHIVKQGGGTEYSLAFAVICVNLAEAHRHILDGKDVSCSFGA